MPFQIVKGNDLHLRQQITDALNLLAAYANQVPGTVAIDLATDWTMVNGTRIPVVAAMSVGDSPPTVSGGAVSITKAGHYRVDGFFAIDTNGVASSKVTILHNGVGVGTRAVVKQAAGNAGTLFQPAAAAVLDCDVGDEILFWAEADTGTQIMVAIGTGAVVSEIKSPSGAFLF